MSLIFEGLIKPSDEDTTAYTEGYFDYADSATASTPVSLTSALGYVDLPNDGLGSQTNLDFLPDGVTSLMDNGVFDFSQLSLGSEILMRVSLSATTLVNNTQIAIRMLFANGLYSIVWLSPLNFKNQVTNYELTPMNMFYIGNLETLNQPAKLQIISDGVASVVVNGFYASIKKRL